MSLSNSSVHAHTSHMSKVSDNATDIDAEANKLLDMINSRKSQIVLGWPSLSLAKVLAAAIDKRTSHGKNSAILFESNAEKDRFDDLFKLLGVDVKPFGCRSFSRQNLLSQLDDTTEEKWFDHLDLLLIPRIEDTLLCPFEWEHLCYRIHDRCVSRDLQMPQLVLICSPRNHAENSLRRNFPIFDLNDGYIYGEHRAHEMTFSSSNVDQLWWTLWAAEDDGYAQPLFAPAPDVEYGVETLLGYFLGLHKVSPSHYQADRETPIDDHLESLQNRLAAEGKIPPGQVLSGNAGGYFVRESECSGISIRDPACNPWRTLRALSQMGGRALLVNLVLPPTMLRGYMIANAYYFRVHPLEPLTPRMLNGLYDCVTQIYLRLSVGSKISLVEVRDILNKCDAFKKKGEDDPIKLLQTLLTDAFGKAVGSRLLTKSEVKWLSRDVHGNQGNRFARQAWVTLQEGSAKRNDDVDWLKEINIRDERAGEKDNIVETIRADHVYQTYIPGQKRALSGKLFQIESVDADSVRVRHTTEPSALYRQSVAVTLNTDARFRSVLQHEDIKGSNFHFQRHIFEIDYTVNVEGWSYSTDFGKSWRRSTAHENRDRVYRPGRALRVLLSDLNGVPLWTTGQILALAQWLNESAISLFPESYRFMIAAAYVPESERPETKPSSEIVPRLSFSAEDPEVEDRGALWLFEDSHADLGIVGAAYDHAEWLLNLCLDYLNWRLDEVGGLEGKSPAPFLLNRARLTDDFLAYGAENPDDKFDFVGLRDCLQDSHLISDRHSLTKARLESLASVIGTGGETAQQESSAGKCDFCGTIVEGEQGHIFNDGRFRCSACGVNAVDKLEDALVIHNDVLEVLRSKFGVEFGLPVKVQFVHASRIAVVKGESFIPTDDFDARSVGLAVAAHSTSSGQQFTIYVENGHSREDTAMTFAHELTHIWQFEKLDYAQMDEEYGKLLIEGHASWVELSCSLELAKRAKTGKAVKNWQKSILKRESDLLSRQDDYGNGYRIILDMFGKDGNVFRLLEDMYPAKK